MDINGLIQEYQQHERIALKTAFAALSQYGFFPTLLNVESANLLHGSEDEDPESLAKAILEFRKLRTILLTLDEAGKSILSSGEIR